MDRIALSEGIIHEWGMMFAEEMHQLWPTLMTGDLGAMEQGLQHATRSACGRVLTDAVRVREDAMDRPEGCPGCGGSLRLTGTTRARQVRGLVGDVRLCRAGYVCTVCHLGHSPLDSALGLGPWGVSPGLARVVSRAGIADSFEDAADSLVETLGIVVPAETIRRVSEAIGAVAEADQQERIAALKDGTGAQTGAGIDTLVVEVDGVQVHLDDAWHEMKIGRVARLGPEGQTDARTGRTTLRLGDSICGGGLDDAEACWYRVQMLAVQAGLGEATRRVVVLSDGAAWIWNRAASFLGGPGRTVIEIVDIFHAYEHLWAVGHALYPDAAACARWVEPLKDALYAQGAAAVMAALDALSPPVPDVREIVRTTRAYFAGHAARMNYPLFVAQQLPIGSGAIESLCKNLVEERAKEAGMRWTGSGVQSIITLRAVHRSGDWTAFWARHPLTEYRRRWPRIPRHRPALTPEVTPSPILTAPVPRPPTPHPWRHGPAIIPRCA